MNTLKLIYLPNLPNIFSKYLTQFSDIESLILVEINLPMIKNMIQQFSDIIFILNINEEYIKISLKSNYSEFSIPNGLYYIIRPSFQYCNNLLNTVIMIKEDNLLKYLFHDVLIIKLLKISHFIKSFNNLSIETVKKKTKVFAIQIINDYFIESNLNFYTFSIENPNMTYQEKINIFNGTNYHKIIEELKLIYLK